MGTMSDTPATDTDTTETVASPPRRKWLVIAAIVAGVLVIAGIAGAVVIANDDDTPDYAADQIGWMHQGCQQWADSYQGANGPNDAWCTSMAGWMNGRMGDNTMMGQGQMMGSMMWQNPTNMATTCEQWMADKPNAAPAGADTSAWCGQMVDWMNQHMGGWDNWMMNGPMMSNP